MVLQLLKVHKIFLPDLVLSCNAGSAEPSRASRDPRLNRPTSQDVDALLRRIRQLEEQILTQKQVISTAQSALTWLQATTEDGLRHAADLKETVAKHIAKADTKEVGTSIPSSPLSKRSSPRSSSYSPGSSPRSIPSSPLSKRSSPRSSSYSPYSPGSSPRSASPYYYQRSSSPYYQPEMSSPFSPMKSGYNGSPSSSWASGAEVETLTDQGIMEVEDEEPQNMQVVRSEITVDRDNSWCYAYQPTEEVFQFSACSSVIVSFSQDSVDIDDGEQMEVIGGSGTDEDPFVVAFPAKVSSFSSLNPQVRSSFLSFLNSSFFFIPQVLFWFSSDFKSSGLHGRRRNRHQREPVHSRLAT